MGVDDEVRVQFVKLMDTSESYVQKNACARALSYSNNKLLVYFLEMISFWIQVPENKRLRKRPFWSKSTFVVTIVTIQKILALRDSWKKQSGFCSFTKVPTRSKSIEIYGCMHLKYMHIIEINRNKYIEIEIESPM